MWILRTVSVGKVSFSYLWIQDQRSRKPKALWNSIIYDIAQSTKTLYHSVSKWPYSATSAYLGIVFLGKKGTYGGFSWNRWAQNNNLARWAGLRWKEVWARISHELFHGLRTWETVHLVQKTEAGKRQKQKQI